MGLCVVSGGASESSTGGSPLKNPNNDSREW